MTEEEKKLLQKLKEDKERLIAIKKMYNKEYEPLKKEESENIQKKHS